MKLKSLIPFFVLFIVTAAVSQDANEIVIHEVTGVFPQDEIPFEIAAAGDKAKAILCLVYPADNNDNPQAVLTSAQARSYSYTFVWIVLKNCKVITQWEINGPKDYDYTSTSSFDASAGQIITSKLFTGNAPTTKGVYELYCKIIVPGGSGSSCSGKCNYRIQ